MGSDRLGEKGEEAVAAAEEEEEEDRSVGRGQTLEPGR